MDFISKEWVNVSTTTEVKTEAFDVRKFKEALIEIRYDGAGIEGEIIVQFASVLRRGALLTDILETDWRPFEGMPVVFTGTDTYLHEYQNGNYGAIRFILRSTNAASVDFIINFNSKPIHSIGGSYE